MSEVSQHRWTVILAFGLVYLFWGSTYLGIAIAVEHLPPALMCATRFLIAGIVMLAYCGFRGRQILFSFRQLWHMAVVGTLLLMGGNLTLSYAERVVPSGLSALLIAVTPLWFLVLDAWLVGDHHISRRGLLGLAFGIVGMMVLLWPKLSAAGSIGRRELWFSLSLLGGSFSWALGSVLSKVWQSRRPVQCDGLAGDLRGPRQLGFRRFQPRLSSRRLDPAGNRSDPLSGRRRILDRLHLLHMVVAPCAQLKGLYVRLRESRRRRLFGMARVARDFGPVHSARKRSSYRVGDSGDQRQGHL